MQDTSFIEKLDRVLITGANGFIGSRVVAALLRSGYRNLRCFVRPSGNRAKLNAILEGFPDARVEIVPGNLLSRSDCGEAVKDVAVILHLAAASDRSFPGCFMNCVVTTRNLLDATVEHGGVRRFVNVSSFAVYSNARLPRRAILDESCSLDSKILDRAEAYAYAKLKQEELVKKYGQTAGLPYVILRPGAVYGPGAPHITGRVGIDTFGVFFHLGGSNWIPFTYVDNCADAIVLAGTKPGVEGEVFNIVDDDLPRSGQFLRNYKKYGRSFRSIRVPYGIFYGFCWAWESYSRWSKGQLPPAFNRNRCETYWKGNRYSNRKLKEMLGWKQATPYSEASQRYFEYVRKAQ